MNDFSEKQKLEEIASPYLDEWYRMHFTSNLLAIIDVTKDPDYQFLGIDKFLVLKRPDSAQLAIFSIDEKVRKEKWTDFLAEIKSKEEKDIPGWVWTDRADYIVYAFFDFQNKALLEDPAFLVTTELQKLIKINCYDEIRAVNRGYTTVSKRIPAGDIKKKKPPDPRNPLLAFML